MTDIKKLDEWCHKILPLVYDNSLSYYEVLCRVVSLLNSVIENVNGIPDYINSLLSDDKLKEILSLLLNELREQIAQNNEGTNETATANSNVGELVWLNGILYRVTRQVYIGDRYAIDSNIERVTVESLVNNIKLVIAEYSEVSNKIASKDIINGELLWFNNQLIRCTKNIEEGTAYILGTNYENVTIEELLEDIKALIAEEVEARKKLIELNENNEAELHQNTIFDGSATIRQDLRCEGAGSFNKKVSFDGHITANDGAEISGTLKYGTVEKINGFSSVGFVDSSGNPYRLLTDDNALSGIDGFVNITSFGATGDGVTDDTEAFKTAIEYCITNNIGLYIPAKGLWDNDKGYILSETLNIDYPMVIVSEPNALLNWKNAHLNTDSTTGSGRNGSLTFKSGYGINIDYGSYGGHKGYYRFGVLQGDKSYTAQGATSPYGHYWTGVRISNSDVVDFHAVYISFWSVGVQITSSNSWTDNNIVRWNVMDDCETGLSIKTVKNYPIENTQIYFNTIGIAKYGISIAGDGVLKNSIINGSSVWVEMPNGTGISSWDTSRVENVQILINNVANHNSEIGASKSGVDTDFYNKIASGNFYNCTISCGCSDVEKYNTLAYEITGYPNIINNPATIMQKSLGEGFTPTSTSSTMSDFNNGVPAMCNVMPIKIENVSAESGTVLYYFIYNTLVNMGTNDQSISATCNDENIILSAVSQSYEEHGRIVLRVKFLSSKTNTTVLGFVKI